MNGIWFSIIAIFAGISITGFLVWRLQRFRKTDAYRQSQKPFVVFLRKEERLFIKCRDTIAGFFKIKSVEFSSWGSVIEILLIGVWALWICRNYLDMNPTMWPIGREVGIQYISHDFWNQLKQCGLCALWNGSVNGGAPSLADPFGSAFHPLVMVTTLAFGIINGVKIATIITLWVVGIAQWSIAASLGARPMIRIWSGILAVVGGHILGKLELGAFGITLATTMATLVLLALMNLIKKNDNPSVFYFATSITLLLISGHGYIQVAVLSWMFLVFLLLWNKPASLKKRFLVSIALGILMAGFLFIPIFHFSPNLGKFTDLEGNLNQYIEYIPLNLVIHDWEFYIKDSLQKPPFPYLTNIYIGWIPVLLAVLTLGFKNDKNKTYINLLTSGIFFFFFLSSGIPFRWVSKIIPFIAGIRHTQLIAGLMVPAILGLAAYSTEQLFRLKWPRLDLILPQGKDFFKISLHWILILPLVFSVYTAHKFNQSFVKLDNVQDVFDIISEIPNEQTLWFSPPFGEHWWVLASIENDLKVSEVVAPWWWKDRVAPKPALQLKYPEASDSGTVISTNDGFSLLQYKDIHYASITDGSEEYPCRATANGGYIKVLCDNEVEGRLIVKENNWGGWRAWRDGRRIQLFGVPWINVEAPAGKHLYILRYQPWDVNLGLVVSAVGLGLSVLIGFFKPASIDQFFNRSSKKSE